LIPALMGLFAQIGGENRLIWRTTFVIAALFGIYSSFRLISKTHTASSLGPFSRHRWLVIALYSLVFLIGLLPGIASLLGLQGLQAEAILLCLLILIAHGLTWEFMTQPPEEMP